MWSKSIILVTAIFIVNCLTTSKGSLQNTELVDYRQYMQDVLQTFIYDLEDAGLCTLRMRDFDQEINETLYNFEVIGILHYTSGFVVGVDSAAIKFNEINTNLNDEYMTASVYTTLAMDGFRIAYDVEGELTNSTHKATGLYLVKGFEWKITSIKDLTTEVVNATVEWMTTKNDQSERIKFLPKNDYTAVFSRKFNTLIPEIQASFKDWIPANFVPIFEKIVREKIPFPTLSYETHLD